MFSYMRLFELQDSTRIHSLLSAHRVIPEAQIEAIVPRHDLLAESAFTIDIDIVLAHRTSVIKQLCHLPRDSLLTCMESHFFMNLI